MAQLSHLYMTTAKTIALTIWTFVSKVIALLFNILSRFVIAFLPRGKHLFISWPVQRQALWPDLGHKMPEAKIKESLACLSFSRTVILSASTSTSTGSIWKLSKLLTLRVFMKAS